MNSPTIDALASFAPCAATVRVSVTAAVDASITVLMALPPADCTNDSVGISAAPTPPVAIIPVCPPVAVRVPIALSSGHR